jgi:hypothetical protein
MKLEQGKIVKWENDKKEQIVWIVCDDEIWELLQAIL